MGAGTILRSGCFVQGYKAEGNRIHIGAVRIGDGAIVGEGSVVDIDTEIGNGAQLGLSSSLQRGERIPDGRRYHGSPAVETTSDYAFVEPRPCGALRRGAYAAMQLAGVLLVSSAVPVALFYLVPSLLHASEGAQFADAAIPPDLTILAAEVFALTLVAYIGALLVGLAVVGVVPRLLYRLVRPGVTYPLYGFHYWVFRTIASVSNSRVYNTIFGDSALIVPYLRYIGYRLNTIRQTGSNFGLDQRHDIPFLCNIGSGTMVADALTMINAPMSASSFALREVRIGSQTYLGNMINVPAAARIGDNCLLATKVMLPIDGPVREGVGLLGAPAFEIPRIVERDQRLKVDDAAEMARLVAGKTRYNLATIALYLAINWVQIAVTTFLFVAAILHFADYGFAAILAFGWASALFTILYFVLVERACLKFGRLQPLVVSMYDRRFWLHERHWKFSASSVDTLLTGTPWKNVVARLLGARLGRRVFDDGCFYVDRTLLEVGDFACLNEDCWLQAHSLEEGAFKADHVRLGRGVTVGTSALVHYGTTVGDNVVIDPDSFVMKGESPEADTTWRGNPASAVRRAAGASRLREVRLPAAAALPRGERRHETGAPREFRRSAGRARRHRGGGCGHHAARARARRARSPAGADAAWPRRRAHARRPAGRARACRTGGLMLSLSHALGATALAVAPFPVGIDIERCEPGVDALAIDAELFGKRDYAFLAAQDRDRQGDAFYRLWTLKEARLKRFGRTLADSELPDIASLAGDDMSTAWLDAPGPPLLPRPVLGLSPAIVRT